MPTPSLLTILVALPCEAKPLLSYYQLKKVYQCKQFPLYCNTKLGINLCVSGMGKVRMAASVAFMQQYLPAISLLNLGIAGSGFAKLGQVFLADKITDVATEQSHYPHLNVSKGVDSQALYTHDRPVGDYPISGMVDMEASGFFKSGSLFGAQELLQVLKIISDTDLAQQQKISPQFVESLVSESLVQIDLIVQAQLQLARAELGCAQLAIDSSEFTARWHFTQYQTNELIGLLRRWQVLQSDNSAIKLVSAAANAKQVLQQLRETLDQTEYVW